MIRRPPRSTLFPTRRSSDLEMGGGDRAEPGEPFGDREPGQDRGVPGPDRLLLEHHGLVRVLRSEEHTSELQSRRDLVCRLLLEKKKKKYSFQQNARDLSS